MIYNSACPKDNRGKDKDMDKEKQKFIEEMMADGAFISVMESVMDIDEHDSADITELSVAHVLNYCYMLIVGTEQYEEPEREEKALMYMEAIEDEYGKFGAFLIASLSDDIRNLIKAAVNCDKSELVIGIIASKKGLI